MNREKDGLLKNIGSILFLFLGDCGIKQVIRFDTYEE
jgi:hypothetical protein